MFLKLNCQLLSRHKNVNLKTFSGAEIDEVIKVVVEETQRETYPEEFQNLSIKKQINPVRCFHYIQFESVILLKEEATVGVSKFHLKLNLK